MTSELADDKKIKSALDELNRQLSNVWNTLGYLAGSPLDTFGAEGEHRIAEGPLSDLY